MNVVALTVMHALLFVLDVCMLRECKGARVAGMLVRGWRRCSCGECMSCGWYTWSR